MLEVPMIFDARVPSRVGEGNAYLLELCLRALRQYRSGGAVNRFLLERALDFIILTELYADRATLAGELADLGLCDKAEAAALVDTSDYAENMSGICEQYRSELETAQAVVRQYGIQSHSEIVASSPSDAVLEEFQALYYKLLGTNRYCDTKTSLPQSVLSTTVQVAWNNVGPWRY